VNLSAVSSPGYRPGFFDFRQASQVTSAIGGELKMPAERIAIPELKKKLDASKKLVVVDVREKSEIKEGGAIPGAIHIPIAQIEKRLEEIPKDAEIVCYCGGGGRASRAAEVFVNAGYKTVEFCGMRDWKKAGLPTVPEL
jgi:rhodanese-related sulfurtransferase